MYAQLRRERASQLVLRFGLLNASTSGNGMHSWLPYVPPPGNLTPGAGLSGIWKRIRSYRCWLCSQLEWAPGRSCTSVESRAAHRWSRRAGSPGGPLAHADHSSSCIALQRRCLIERRAIRSVVRPHTVVAPRRNARRRHVEHEVRGNQDGVAGLEGRSSGSSRQAQWTKGNLAATTIPTLSKQRAAARALAATAFRRPVSIISSRVNAHRTSISILP